MKMHVKLLVAALLLIIPAVRADDPPTSQPTKSEAVKLRERFNLPRLVLLRQAAQEYDFNDDELRDRVLQIMDDTRDEILDVIEHEKASPSEPQELDANVKQVQKQFGYQLNELVRANPSLQTGIGKQMQQLQAEMTLFLETDAAATLKPLELNPEQQKKVDELLADAQQKLKEPPGEVSPQEARDKIGIESRARLREILTEEQRTQFAKFAQEKQRDAQAKNAANLRVIGGAILRAAPPPPPAPAKP